MPLGVESKKSRIIPDGFRKIPHHRAFPRIAAQPPDFKSLS
jgi:hypothetical protein